MNVCETYCSSAFLGYFPPMPPSFSSDRSLILVTLCITPGDIFKINEPITHLLKAVQWLSRAFRIENHILDVAYKVSHGPAPCCLWSFYLSAHFRASLSGTPVSHSPPQTSSRPLPSWFQLLLQIDPKESVSVRIKAGD